MSDREGIGDGTVSAMLDEIRSAPEVVRPSAFWEHLNELNLGQLERDGFGEFKRTVNRNYFQWMDANPLGEQYRAVLRRWAKHPTLAPFTTGLEDGFPVEGVSRRRRAAVGRSYAFYLGAMHGLVRRLDYLGALNVLEEPALGHPVAASVRGRRVSEDLLNSVLELNAIAGGLPGGRLPVGATVIELGGGYGRFAWALLSVQPDARLIMVDIPPALAIAQRYLTTLFPDRPAFRFRRFTDAAGVLDELRAARLVFLTPNQLDLLPPQAAELIVNISSLHEMRPDQIGHYLRLFDRHGAGWLYSKQWVRSENPHDGLVIAREDYPIPASWSVVFDRIHPVQRRFFEALYRLR